MYRAEIFIIYIIIKSHLKVNKLAVIILFTTTVY